MGFFNALGLGVGASTEAMQQQQHQQQLNTSYTLANEKQRQDVAAAETNRADARRFYEQLQGIKGKDATAKAYEEEAKRANMAHDFKWGEQAAASADKLRAELSDEQKAATEKIVAAKDDVAKRAVTMAYSGTPPAPEEVKALSEAAVAAGMPAAPDDPKNVPQWLLQTRTANMDSKVATTTLEKKREFDQNQQRLDGEAKARAAALLEQRRITNMQRDVKLAAAVAAQQQKVAATTGDELTRQVNAEQYISGAEAKTILGSRPSAPQIMQLRKDAFAQLQEEHPDFTPKQLAALLTASQREFKNIDAGASAFTKKAAGTVAAITMASVEANDMMAVTKTFLKDHPDLNKYASTDVNSLLNMAKRHSSDPDFLKLETYLFAITNSYSRATAPNGTLALMDREHAREKLANRFQGKSLIAVMEAMQEEMSTAEASARKVLSSGVAGSVHTQAAGEPAKGKFKYEVVQ